MKEIPSPNVTYIRPQIFVAGTLPNCTDFSIKSHGRGIFEFNPLSKAGSLGVVNALERTFEDYNIAGATYPVTITGAKVDSNESKLAGSTRFCTMNPQFAEYLTDVIANRSVIDIISTEHMKEQYTGSGIAFTSKQVHWWEMINVSQYFRFMKYSTGGEHFPHYDSDFVYEYNYAITKYSIVVYFNDCDSGELAFIDDNTEHAENKSDWTRQATDAEIFLKIRPSAMKILLFPHTLCHTVLPFTDKNNVRYICRGDVLFQRVNR